MAAAIVDPPESDLLTPVLRLFPKKRFRRFPEAELGRKRIDLLCVPLIEAEQSVSVELKIKDWKQALWQASHNFHVAEESYVAIWHRYLAAAEKNRELFESYGVGLIVVRPKSAAIVFRSKDLIFRVARSHKATFYQRLVGGI